MNYWHRIISQEAFFLWIGSILNSCGHLFFWTNNLRSDLSPSFKKKNSRCEHKKNQCIFFHPLNFQFSAGRQGDKYIYFKNSSKWSSNTWASICYWACYLFQQPMLKAEQCETQSSCETTTETKTNWASAGGIGAGVVVLGALAGGGGGSGGGGSSSSSSTDTTDSSNNNNSGSTPTTPTLIGRLLDSAVVGASWIAV